MWTVQALSSCDPSVTSLFLENGFQRVLGRVKIVVQCQGHSNWFYGVQMQFQMDFNVSKWRAVLLAVLVATGAYKEVSFWVLLGFGLFLFFPFFLYIFLGMCGCMCECIHVCGHMCTYTYVPTYRSQRLISYIFSCCSLPCLFFVCLFGWLVETVSGSHRFSMWTSELMMSYCFCLRALGLTGPSHHASLIPQVLGSQTQVANTLLTELSPQPQVWLFWS